MPSAPTAGSIWTRSFALLCSAQFLGYAHHFILQPTLPLYITELGGTPFIVGLVIAAFGITSVIARPFIGAWVDRWHGGGVMVCGLFFLAASVTFCFLPFVGATILTNGLRGIGWAGLNTGGYTLLAASAPRRSFRLLRRGASLRHDLFPRRRTVDRLFAL